MSEDVAALREALTRCRHEVAKVIIGQDRAVDFALIAVFTGNHALIEGVPGVAKTLLVRTIAAVLDCHFERIQFTPDLMPADITGVNVFDLQKREFALIRGPVFTDFLLADEINRAPAKTQAALLQAMQERSVTIDRTSHMLSPAFTVFATQNPIEFEGTYPLPEAQKDRFMLKIPMGFPDGEEEHALAHRLLGDQAPEAVLARGDVVKVLRSQDLPLFRRCLQSVLVRDELVRYVVDLVRRTRDHASVLVGAGPRAMQALLLSSRAHAVIAGRDFVTPDDVKSMVAPALAHRLILRPEYEIEGLSIDELLVSIVKEVKVPL
jgi:MoxR-like ATPase